MKENKAYRSPLSRRDVRRYREGDERTRRTIEGNADSFDQDALDGWTQSRIRMENAMNRTDRKFLKKSPALYVIVVVLLIIGAGIPLLRNSESFTRRNEQPQQTARVQLKVEKSDLVLEPAIDSMTAAPEVKQIKIATVIASQKAIDEQPASVPVIDLKAIPIDILPQKQAEIKTAEPEISRQRTAKEVYFEGLKLIDYTQYRARPVIKTEQQLLTGTPADMENEDAPRETEIKVSKVDVPYMTYIRKTAKTVSKGKWKDALQRLEIILKTYPDDVNGHFYAGLCCYNLQQYEAAVKHFRTCLQLPFSNFNEESSWYLALSILASGERQQAKELLIIIRDQKGYYSKQAEKALREM